MLCNFPTILCLSALLFLGNCLAAADGSSASAGEHLTNDEALAAAIRFANSAPLHSGLDRIHDPDAREAALSFTNSILELIANERSFKPTRASTPDDYRKLANLLRQLAPQFAARLSEQLINPIDSSKQSVSVTQEVEDPAEHSPTRIPPINSDAIRRVLRGASSGQIHDPVAQEIAEQLVSNIHHRIADERRFDAVHHIVLSSESEEISTALRALAPGVARELAYHLTAPIDRHQPGTVSGVFRHKLETAGSSGTSDTSPGRTTSDPPVAQRAPADPVDVLLFSIPALFAGILVLYYGFRSGTIAKVFRTLQGTAIVLLIFATSFTVVDTASAWQIYRRYYNNGGYVDFYYNRGGREIQIAGHLPKGPADDDSRQVAPSPPPPFDDEAPIPPAPEPDESDPMAPAPLPADNGLDFRGAGADDLEDVSPAWHFEKRVSLPTVLGDAELPYDGFRGCAPFVCASLLHAYGHPLDQTMVAAIEALDPERDGTPRECTLSLLGQFFTVEARDDVSPEELVSHLDSALPVYVCISEFDQMHAALVTGYHQGPSSEILSWTLTDNGVSGGEIPHDRFLDLWDYSPRSNNSAIFIYPKDTSVPPALRFVQELRLPAFATPRSISLPFNDLAVYTNLFAALGCDIHPSVVRHIARHVDSQNFPAHLAQFFDIDWASDTNPSHLLEQLRSGVPPIIFARLSGEEIYCLVSGCRLDQFGNPVSWTIAGPTTHHLSHAQLLAAWETSQARNFSVSITRNPDKLPPSFEHLEDEATNSSQVPDPRTCYQGGPEAIAVLLQVLEQHAEDKTQLDLSNLLDPEDDGMSAEEIEQYLEPRFGLNRDAKLSLESLEAELHAGRPLLLRLEDMNGLQKWSVITGHRQDGDAPRRWDIAQDGNEYTQLTNGLLLRSNIFNTDAFFLQSGPSNIPPPSAELLFPIQPSKMEDVNPANLASLSETETPPAPPSGAADLADRPSSVSDTLSSIGWRYTFLLVGLVAVAIAAAYLTQPRFSTV